MTEDLLRFVIDHPEDDTVVVIEQYW